MNCFNSRELFDFMVQNLSGVKQCQQASPKSFCGLKCLQHQMCEVPIMPLGTEWQSTEYPPVKVWLYQRRETNLGKERTMVAHHINGPHSLRLCESRPTGNVRHQTTTTVGTWIVRTLYHAGKLLNGDVKFFRKSITI